MHTCIYQRTHKNTHAHAHTHRHIHTHKRTPTCIRSHTHQRDRLRGGAVTAGPLSLLSIRYLPNIIGLAVPPHLTASSHLPTDLMHCLNAALRSINNYSPHPLPPPPSLSLSLSLSLSWALWLTHTEFGFSLCPSATPTLPVETHTESGFSLCPSPSSLSLPISLPLSLQYRPDRAWG